MPVRVVGRAAKFSGKTLFEIACNLKHFGVGRVLVRSIFERYSEPSYFKIISVEPEMDSENKRGKVIVEQVFRGRNFGVRPIASGCKPDFRLVAKEDEQELFHRPFVPLKEKIYPAARPFPPLLQHMITEEMKATGQSCDKEPLLKMCYQSSMHALYRPADEDEEPNAEISKHVSWNLYEDVMAKPS